MTPPRRRHRRNYKTSGRRAMLSFGRLNGYTFTRRNMPRRMIRPYRRLFRTGNVFKIPEPAELAVVLRLSRGVSSDSSIGERGESDSQPCILADLVDGWRPSKVAHRSVSVLARRFVNGGGGGLCPFVRRARPAHHHVKGIPRRGSPRWKRVRPRPNVQQPTTCSPLCGRYMSCDDENAILPLVGS